MHTVAVLALDGVIPFDLATPVEAFGRARRPGGDPCYRVLVCAEAPDIDTGTFTLRAHRGLDALAEADTIIIPGIARPTAALPENCRAGLLAAAARGARIASICSGAFPFAATGLLDGLRATTHWMAAELLAARYPAIEVDPNVLYVDNGRFLTSAGAAAGVDMCLHLIRRDHGSAVAADAARQAVMPLEREGGQAQFIPHDHVPIPAGAGLEPTLRWIQENLARPLTLADIAAHAGVSDRTLLRRFAEQTGSTPLQWVHRARVRRAQQLLETSSDSVEHIGDRVGFGSAAGFRERFKRTTGVSPGAYRRAFR